MSTVTIPRRPQTKLKNKPVAAKTVVTVPLELERVLTPKNAALEQLGNLKDDVSWEEIFYWLELRESLEKSALDYNNGMYYTHEEAKAEFEKWFK